MQRESVIMDFVLEDKDDQTISNQMINLIFVLFNEQLSNLTHFYQKYISKLFKFIL